MNEQDAIKRLKDLVIKFRDERDWKQFHSPKNLAAAITVEAAELLELYQWGEEPRNKAAVKEEVGDILNLLLLFCHEAGIDLEQATIEKLNKNAERYPIDKVRGSSKKYSDYDQS